MSVAIRVGVVRLLDNAFEQYTDDMVTTAAGAAPVDTGNLAGHIHKTKLGLGTYIISTNSVGHNGVAYPLKIEQGDSVDGYQHFVYRNVEIRTMHVNASAQSHFMRAAVSKYGGRYYGK